MTSTVEVDQLIEELISPRTRWAARRKLVELQAVEPLVDCLKSPRESVRWAAVQSLGELRAEIAVEPLVEMLERGELTLDVVDALQNITGEEHGTDAKRWRHYLANHQKTSKPSLAECVEQAAELLGVSPEAKGNAFRLTLQLPDDRQQKVWVQEYDRADAEDLIIIYSECAPADPKHYEAILKRNLTLPGPAFALREIEGTLTLVLVHTLHGYALSARQLAKSIAAVAARADHVEKGSSNEDRN